MPPAVFALQSRETTNGIGVNRVTLDIVKVRINGFAKVRSACPVVGRDQVQCEVICLDIDGLNTSDRRMPLGIMNS